MVRVGLWGTSDIEHLGDVLGTTIVAAELARRLPVMTPLAAAPLGYVGRSRFEATPAPAPLGVWSVEGVEDWADRLDLLVIGPGQIVHGDDGRLAPWYGMDAADLEARAPSRFFIEGLGAREGDLPVAWTGIGVEGPAHPELAARWRGGASSRALIAVRDEPSRAALRAAGVGADVEVVPDVSLVVARDLPVDGLADRVARLRAAGSFPVGDALVVHAAAGLAADVDALAAGVRVVCAERALTPVIVEAEPIAGDGRVAHALRVALPEAVSLPPSAGVDDVCAAVAWSAVVVGASRSLAVVATGYGRPAVVVDTQGRGGLADLFTRLGRPGAVVRDVAAVADACRDAIAAGVDDEAVAREVAALDAHLDAVAALVGDGAAVAIPTGPPSRSSSDAPASLDDERERYARATRALGTRLASQQAAFAARERELDRLLAMLGRELTEADIRFTRLWRKIHEGDRHYNWHKQRADGAEERVIELERRLRRYDRIPWRRAWNKARRTLAARSKTDSGGAA